MPAAISVRASGLRALSGRTLQARAAPPAAGEAGAGETAGGASSRTTWALVPPKPKELTPARAGPSWSGQGTARVGISYGRVAGSMAGLRFSRLMWGGMVRCLRLRTVLISPATPAADSVCPMFVLTEPT